MFFYIHTQNFNLVLLQQEYAAKTDPYWGLTFLGFFEKCAAIIFYASHFASFTAQIHHVSSLKHKFEYQSEKRGLHSKNSKIGMATLKFHVKWKCFIPLVFFTCKYRYRLIFHFWCVLFFWKYDLKLVSTWNFKYITFGTWKIKVTGQSKTEFQVETNLRSCFRNLLSIYN
jgi:hypothetical protein